MDFSDPAPDRACPACKSRFPAGANFCPHDGQRLEDVPAAPVAHDPLIDTVLDGRYRLAARLGQGGMGVVYEARHAVIDKQVAVKILREEYCRDPGMVERFMREARAASHIGHPNIVDVTDFGRTADGQVYFVMEFLVGTTLSKELREQSQLPLGRALHIAQQICHGLADAHGKGIVHRDLKPENIFVVNPEDERAPDPSRAAGRRDFVKLLDFGIAKFTFGPGARLTQAGSIFGTPQYMSPEQAGGHDGDHRGDIYALGCILYEMVTGTVPFLAETFMGTLSKHMFEPPEPPSSRRPDLAISPELEATILRALSKSPDARFQTMTEMAEALASCEVEPAAPAAPEEPPPADERPAEAPADEISRVADAQPEPAWASAEPARRARPAPLTEDVRHLGGRAPSRRPHIAIGVFIAVAIGVGAYFALRDAPSGPDEAQDAAAAGQGPDLAVPARDAARPADAPAAGHDGAAEASVAAVDSSALRLVALQVNSVPPGARVSLQGKHLGVTPLTVRVSPGGTVALTFRKRRYWPRVIPVPIGDGDQKLVVPLVRRTKGTGPDERPRLEDLRKPPGL